MTKTSRHPHPARFLTPVLLRAHVASVPSPGTRNGSGSVRTLRRVARLMLTACVFAGGSCVPPRAAEAPTYEPSSAEGCSTSELISRATNKDWGHTVRMYAILELGTREQDTARAVPALIAVIQDPETEARVYITAVSALGEMGLRARQAVPALIEQIPKSRSKVVKLKDGMYAAAVASALESITGQDFGDDQQQWQRWAGVSMTNNLAAAAESAPLQQACDRGDLQACNRLGKCYRLGKCGLPVAGKRAGELYQKSCEAGDVAGCSNLGSCYRSGDCGFEEDSERAGQLFQKACNGGSMTACANLAICYEDRLFSSSAS
jgi:hypothetical protein